MRFTQREKHEVRHEKPVASGVQDEVYSFVDQENIQEKSKLF